MPPIYRKQRPGIHADGAPVARASLGSTARAAARLGPIAGASTAARAEIEGLLAQAGIAVGKHALVGPDGGVIGGTTKHAPVDTKGGSGPHSYTGGAYGGLVAGRGGSRTSDLATGLMGVLTGGAAEGNGDFGLNAVDLAASNINGRLSPNDAAGRAQDLNRQERERLEAKEQARESIEGAIDSHLGENGPRQPERKDAYDPDAAGPGGNNPWSQRVYAAPKTGNGSTTDSEFGGTTASRASGGGSGLRLSVRLNDAPARATAAGPSTMVARLPRRIGPGGRPFR